VRSTLSFGVVGNAYRKNKHSFEVLLLRAALQS
jgi:hypothetical protein